MSQYFYPYHPEVYFLIISLENKDAEARCLLSFSDVYAVFEQFSMKHVQAKTTKIVTVMDFWAKDKQ